MKDEEKSVITNKIHVRWFEDSDARQISEICRLHHERTVMADIPFCQRKVEKSLQRINQSKSDFIIVTEYKNNIIGFCWFSYGEYMLGYKEIISTIKMIAIRYGGRNKFLSTKSFIRIVYYVTKCAREIASRRILIHVTTGTEAEHPDRVLYKMGWKMIGGSFINVLKS